MNNHPRKVLVFVDWFIPAYKAGGPIRSVYNLIRLMEEELNFSVVTSDQDYNESTTLPGITSDKWSVSEGIRTIYLSSENRSITKIRNLIKSEAPAVVYLNSIFSVYYAIVPLLLCKFFFKEVKVVLAPRGMLAPEALKIKSSKKKLFLNLFRFLGLKSRVSWHATNVEEKDQILKQFGKAEIIIAPNPVILPSLTGTKKVKKSDSLRLVSVARISPEKNLLYGLKRLAELSVPFELDIYGTINDQKYWEECKAVIGKISSKSEVHYKGAADYSLLAEVYKRADFLFLPTLGENFGHVVFESLSFGTPVIISDKTPWNALEEKQCGWDIPLEDKGKFLKVLQHCYEMGEDEYLCLSDNSRKVADKFANDPEIKRSFSLLFN